MIKLSANDTAHSPALPSAGQGVIQFPDWQARLQEKALAEEVKGVWRRGILALLKHCGMAQVEVTRGAARAFWREREEAGDSNSEREKHLHAGTLDLRPLGRFFHRRLTGEHFRIRWRGFLALDSDIY